MASTRVKDTARPVLPSDAPNSIYGDNDLTTQDRLRARARSIRAKAEQLIAEATVLERAADQLEAVIVRRKDTERIRLLPDAAQSSVNEQMEMSATVRKQKNLAISETMSTDRLVAVARQKKGWSLRALARAMNISAGSLLNYRRGISPIPKRHAEWIERELGLPPTRSLWPAGVSG